MRKEVPELGWGDFDIIDVKNPGVLVMRYESASARSSWWWRRPL